MRKDTLLIFFCQSHVRFRLNRTDRKFLFLSVLKEMLEKKTRLENRVSLKSLESLENRASLIKSLEEKKLLIENLLQLKANLEISLEEKKLLIERLQASLKANQIITYLAILSITLMVAVIIIYRRYKLLFTMSAKVKF